MASGIGASKVRVSFVSMSSKDKWYECKACLGKSLIISVKTIGVPLAHTLIAFQSTLKGLDKLVLNEAAISQELENNWAVVAEAIQTILRREGFEKPYEALKGLTRTHDKVTQASVHEFIESLTISKDLKEELKNINPSNYLGIQMVE